MNEEEIKERIKLLEIDSEYAAKLDTLYNELTEEYNELVRDYNKLVDENEQLKNCYCNRTDCAARIKDSKKYDSVQQRIDKVIDILQELRLLTPMEYNREEQIDLLIEILRGSNKE